MLKGCPYGSHRVLEPIGALPQTATRLDNDFSKVYDNEVRIKVQTLNVDSASFAQIEEEAAGDEKRIGEIITDIVGRFGKLQNPVTGSGGTLLGTVDGVGPAIEDKVDVQPGDTVVTLVSLSLTPLALDEIIGVHRETDQVDVRGEAVLFERSIYAKLPDDLPAKVVLALLDVAGAAPQAHKLVKPGAIVFVLGAGGKSGMLCAYQARKDVGPRGLVIGTGHSDASTKRIEELGFCHQVIQIDATKPLEVERKVRELTDGRMADVTINCVNVPGTEMASVMATNEDGVIYFFNMATSFTRAALGAEGIAHGATMIIGNGYTEGHARFSLNLLRENCELRQVFEELYA